jgi:hypothetical protein
MATSIIGVEHHLQQYVTDILLKVVFNTNNTGYHVIHDILLKVVFNTNKTGPMLYRITDILLKVALSTNETVHHVIYVMYNMVTSIIGVEHHFQQYVSYPV